jgi:Tol biopolymer transport system component
MPPSGNASVVTADSEPSADRATAPLAPRFRNPVWSPDSRYLALSDHGRGGVYLYDTLGDSCLQITDSPSSGYACNFSPDGGRLGFKLLIPSDGRSFPLQVPVVFDLHQRRLIPLHTAVAQAGVPSFADDGKVAFTIGEELRVLDRTGKLTATFTLGHYVNLAPISPDGTRVAYNSDDDRMLLLDLATGETAPLTHDEQACFNPVWSPDSRRLVVSTVSGRMRSIDIPTGQVHELGEGTTPSWSLDGSTIVYTRLDRIDGVRVTDAAICEIQWDGSGKRRLEVDPELHGMEARPSPGGDRIAFVALNGGELYSAPLEPTGSESASRRPGPGQLAIGLPTSIVNAATPIITLGDAGASALSGTGSAASSEAAPLLTSVGLTRACPYLHQVYDTPDDFNGHWACGASSALMAINYFYVLDYWDVTCSWPYPHVSHYGQYVSEIYTFNGYTYDIRGKDPSHNWAYGGYGYIIQNNWEDTKGHMRDYIIQHGLSSSVDWSPTWNKLQAEVDNDDPFVLLNSLTTAGHYIVTIGYVAGQRTAVFNDPYGNKNTPGYPSYDGAGAMYDWPGYNNGFENLNTVHCFIYCRGSLEPTITHQPQDQSVAWCDNATFTVTAVGEGTLTWQWQKGTTPLANDSHYVGTASATLTILNVTDLQAGDYRCMVSNSSGSVFSDPATLTVIGPPVAPADLDKDGDVDQVDFGLFQACQSGQSVPQPDPTCTGALLDEDSDVDVYDTMIFLGCMSGQGVPADVYCAEP